MVIDLPGLGISRCAWPPCKDVQRGRISGMGVRTDVVVAERDEAQAIAGTDNPAEHREGFSFSGFDHVQLCTLLSLLRTGGPDAEFEHCLDSVTLVSATSGEWPVVTVVPPELVVEIAGVASLVLTEFEPLAAAWAATKEFAGWLPTDVEALLRELGDLAESASFQRKCLMIWQSL
jgi:hypothetical protein